MLILSHNNYVPACLYHIMSHVSPYFFLTSTTGEPAVNLCGDVQLSSDSIVAGSLCCNNTEASTSMVDNDTVVSEPTIVASQAASANTNPTAD